MLDDNAAFCDKCGKPFDVAETPAEPVAPAEPAEAPAAPAEPVAEPIEVSAEPVEAPAEPEAPQPAAPAYGEAPYAPDAPQYTAPSYGAAPAAVAVAEKKSFFQAKKGLIIACAAILVLIIALVVGFVTGAFSGTGGPEGTLQKAFDCAKNLDMRGSAQLSYELNFSEDVDLEEEIKTAEEQMKALGSMVDMVKTMMKDAKVEIIKSEKVSDDKLNEFKEDWSSDYTDTDKITEIHEITYKITGMSSFTGESDEPEEMTGYVVKVNGKWYVKGMNII